MTRILPRPRARLHRRQGQRGISLVLVLLFLIILTLVGLAASMSSLSSERMARNTRDQNIALQAAEAALRDARNDIRNIRFISGVTGAALTCDVAGFKGFCLPAVTGKPAWDLYLEDPARSVELGEVTLLTADQKLPTVAAAGSNGVSRQPRYLIESIPDINEGSLEAGNIKYVFRVSAIGYGANPSTKVMIQEVVRF
ncbi:type IV pilus assembly protein PilX [Cupriavidus sp. OV038]|jgi:type IV pilus assembly protein PilX|uniref:pilus assembly PilX family protein n=1 Tax=unclassified Cupriavidus TaxID=2640874 RepID=UPI0008F2D493|nr:MULTISPECIES: PilX N-terminal domain-containing pilus assembly protein [unclassified Cupriavidus]SFB77705.1 type IV pilus assembly protein PilX [Cupriavidus sp. OV038]SFO65182.1 type IV pilus assembly protein PilX [Cupriavidus sp. OV096]